MSRQRWWGWGTDGHDGPLPEAGEALLAEELGLGTERTVLPALEELELPPSTLTDGARAKLEEIVGAGWVRDDHEARVLHSAGRSYPDLLALRSGELSHAPDAIVSPADHAEVLAVLGACADLDLAVIPFGGGTSVVGGVAPLAGEHGGAICLDLARLTGLLELDRRSGLARFGAGTFGPDAESELAAHGLTLGHHPQSFEFSTVGGWVATRSAGQGSTGYGRIDELVQGVRMAAPGGEVTTGSGPASAAGPDLRELLVGSEGTLGVLTEATLRVRPAPGATRYEALALPGFAAAVEALRGLAQAGAAATVTRLSDEEETRVNLAMSGSPRAAAALRAYLRARGLSQPCLLILGWEGATDAALRARREAGHRVLRDHAAISLGEKPGEAWAHSRFHGPYLRDELMSRRMLVDTLETAATWTDLLATYRAVGAALRSSLASRGTPALVGCHVSHLYPTGASLYFTFLARQEEGAELEQWQATKRAAGDALAAAGATITHHHAVGSDHAPWLPGEIGELGVDLLRAAKRTLDPTGIMNPGKLIDAAPLPS
ncbi:MAG: FAD-binding oxidoreductase [Solirubrobacterales bacterium]|nr:FAD-binding oxidoreductase [Solirubrobacterales bacterium]